MSHQNQPVSRKTLLSIFATALITFAGILSETLAHCNGLRQVICWLSPSQLHSELR